MIREISKITLIGIAALFVLLMVSQFPATYLGGRGVSGKGLFIFVNESTFYALVFYSISMCFLTGALLKLAKSKALTLSLALATINLSILILDSRATRYSEYVEKLITENYGSYELIMSLGATLFTTGFVSFALLSCRFIYAHNKQQYLGG